MWRANLFGSSARATSTSWHLLGTDSTMQAEETPEHRRPATSSGTTRRRRASSTCSHPRLPDDPARPSSPTSCCRPPPGTRSTTSPPPTCTRSSTPSTRRSHLPGRRRRTGTCSRSWRTRSPAGEGASRHPHRPGGRAAAARHTGGDGHAPWRREGLEEGRAEPVRGKTMPSWSWSSATTPPSPRRWSVGPLMEESASHQGGSLRRQRGDRLLRGKNGAVRGGRATAGRA